MKEFGEEKDIKNTIISLIQVLKQGVGAKR